MKRVLERPLQALNDRGGDTLSGDDQRPVRIRHLIGTTQAKGYDRCRGSKPGVGSIESVARQEIQELVARFLDEVGALLGRKKSGGRPRARHDGWLLPWPWDTLGCCRSSNRARKVGGHVRR